MKAILHSVFPFLAWVRLISPASLRADVIAGMTGAVIVLPQGIAFATIAGLPPEYGLYTAMVTPVVAALFGSSRHLVSGPTTAISIVVFAAISQHAVPGTPEFVSLAITLTFLTGIYQLAFGLARLGVLVNFVSHTVVVGFTAGAAILIATSQIKNMLGIEVPTGATFVHTWMDIGHLLGDTNLIILFISLLTLGLAIILKRYWPKIPNLLPVLILASLIGYLIGGESRGVSVIGTVPADFPPFAVPAFSFEILSKLAPEAFAVALLGLIEAVSISRSIATKSTQRIDSNQEFVGQGLSNVVGSFLSCYAGSGSFTRSGVNYTAGAVTPLSAIFAAVFLLIIVLLVAPLVAYIPVAAMASVILLVAYNLIDFSQVRHILSSSRSESSILIATFLATLLAELEFAIYLGVILSIIIFLARTSTPEIVNLAPVFDAVNNRRNLFDTQVRAAPECPQIKIIRIDMSVYFGSVMHIQAKINRIIEIENIKHILIFGTGINFVDLNGEEMLLAEAKRLQRAGGGLYFVSLKPAVFKSMKKSGFIESVGYDYFFDEKYTAIKTLYGHADKNQCATCRVKVFMECRENPTVPEVAETRQPTPKVTKTVDTGRRQNKDNQKHISQNKKHGQSQKVPWITRFSVWA